MKRTHDKFQFLELTNSVLIRYKGETVREVWKSGDAEIDRERLEIAIEELEERLDYSELAILKRRLAAVRKTLDQECHNREFSTEDYMDLCNEEGNLERKIASLTQEAE